MRRSGPRADKGIGAALLVSAALLFAGCLGDVTGEGVEESGSVLSAIVTPTYFEEATKQVDALRDMCGDDPENMEPEKFTDHLASISFTNRVWPNASSQTAGPVFIDSYRIAYSPARSGLPDLDSTEVGLAKSLEIPPCPADSTSCSATTYQGFTFVSLRTKAEYIEKGGDPFVQGAYNVTYTFYAHTIVGKAVRFSAEADFLILDYDFCK
jgi:hypothetical protein